MRRLSSENWSELQASILGLGETSVHKTHYASLRQRISELERFRSMVDLSTDMLFEVDIASGEVLSANRTATRVLAHGEDVAEWPRFQDLISRDCWSAMQEASSESAAQASVVLVTDLMQASGGTIPCELSVNFVTGSSGTLAIVSARDVSQRVRAEEERAELEEQLRQAQKMESIGRFAGGVAHDFNNLLAVILGFQDIAAAQAQAQDTAGVQQSLSEIGRAAGRAAELTRQLLAFGRKQVLRPVTFDANEFLADMHGMLRRLIGSNIELVTLPAEEPAFIHADRSQMQQVILNLAANARDAMPSGGTLSIRILAGQTAETEAATVSLIVSDTGVGMDEATKKRMFEPFFTTKPVHKGTGLGLAAAYGVVRQSGGHIEVASEVGAGTQITITLPAAERTVAAGEAATAEAGGTEMMRGSERILLVEDQPTLRQIAKRTLLQQGYQVYEAADAAEALGFLESLEGDVDLLVTDIVMPGMSGLDLARKAADLQKNLNVLFMTGYSEASLGLQPDDVRSEKLLQKPFTPRQLCQAVRSALSK